MKTTRWLSISLAGIFLPYGDCNPGKVDEIKAIIQAKSLHHALKTEEYKTYLEVILLIFMRMNMHKCL